MAQATPSSAQDIGFRFIAAELGRRVRNGEWKAGSSLPSLRKLAAQYHVGVKTVRLAALTLRNQGLLVITRRHRLVVAEAEQAWLPTPKPVLLVLGDPLSGFIQPSYAQDLLTGLLEGVERHQHALLVFQGPPARRQPPLDLIDRPLQGVVLLGKLGLEVIGHYQKLKCPVVLLDRPLVAEGVHRVLVDNIQAARQATHRLFEAGHNNLALVYSTDPHSTERKLGFLAALAEHGRPRCPEALLSTKADYEQNRRALRRLFRGRNPCTAVLASGEYEADWLIHGLSQLELQVPRDASLVCFHARSTTPARFSGPAVDFTEMGRRAYALLKEPKAPARLIRVAPEWSDGKTLLLRPHS